MPNGGKSDVQQDRMNYNCFQFSAMLFMLYSLRIHTAIKHIIIIAVVYWGTIYSYSYNTESIEVFVTC